MRIPELFEHRFNERDFVEKRGDRTELAYDLAEDLAYFLINDDDIYRQYTYPIIAKHSKRKYFDSSLFKEIVNPVYEIYRKKYPIRELPNTLDEKLIRAVCEKLYNMIQKDTNLDLP